MPEVIKISHGPECLSTKAYPHASWDFDEFNPIQSRLLETYDGTANLAVAAATSSGKTVMGEMYLANEIRKHGKKGIYIGPLRALAKEKEQDWTSAEHHFGDLNVFIATGDYRYTARRIKEMDEASLVVATPEMLASLCRNHRSAKSQFLLDAGVVVVDESHLLTVPDRGSHIEVALMKLTEINPDIRVVALSATMPNVDEICGWISKLTGRDTHYLESDYRPCPLNVHYESYYDGDKNYDDKELQKVGTACAIVEHYPDDKFLIFTHTKRTGAVMVENLIRYGVNAEFHNADVSLKERLSFESRFKNDKNFRVLVATSTLAWGINCPARRVIVVGVHRGLQEVANYDVNQMVGRAGRPRFDKMGDAYILVPEETKKEWIAKLKKNPPIRSTLLDFAGKAEKPHYKTLAFHIVSEIHHGGIDTKQAFHDWFRRSLAHHQEHAFDDNVIDRTIELLEQFRAIVSEDDHYVCTAVGKIASMFYFSPFDVSDLRRNFNKLFGDNKEGDDYAVSIALGDTDSHRYGIANRQEQAAFDPYKRKIETMYGEARYGPGVIKAGAAYFNLLKGKHDKPALQALQNTLLADLDRTMVVMSSIDSMSCQWGRESWLRTLGMRLRYGVEADLVELCQIPNVGHVRANRLKAARIKTLGEFTSRDAKGLALIMKCGVKLAEEALDAARLIELKQAV